MTKDLKRKEIIEQALLDCMNSMDEALMQIAALNTDNDSYSKINQCKSHIKNELNMYYDKLARQKSTTE